MKRTNNLVKILLGAGLAVSLIFAMAGGNPARAQEGCVPSPDGLAHWWPGDGNAADVVGGRDGMLMNGAGFTPGKVGGAFAFDGSDDFVALPGTYGGGEGEEWTEATIEAWVKTTGTTGDFQAIVSSTLFEFVHLQLHTIGNIGFYKSPPGPATFPGDTEIFVALPIVSPTPTNVYRHIALSIKSGDSRLYVDGAQVGAARSTEFEYIRPTSDLLIGAGASGFRFFKGEIDEVSIFNRALGAGEIQTIYNAGSAGKCKPGILVEPNDVVDFGQINAFTSKDAIVTISNTGDAGREVSDVAVTAGGSVFSITNFDPPGSPPLALLPGEDVFVTLTFFPNSDGEHIGTLTVTSDDPVEPIISVNLIGNGLVGAVADQATVLEAAVDDAIEAGTLVGSGSGNSAAGRLGAFANMIEAAGDLIEAQLFEDACGQLRSALRRVDGDPRPPDFVNGVDADLIAEQIEFLMASPPLDCQ